MCEDYNKYDKLPKAWPLIARRLTHQWNNAGLKVIDVGCRIGTTIWKLRQMGYNAVGIDINQEYVERAIERSGCEVWKMNANNMAFPDKHFDIIICTETLEHVDNQLVALEEFERVLKDNGKIFLSVPNPNHLVRMIYPKHFVPAELASRHIAVNDLTQCLTLFELSGLRVINWKGFPDRWIFPRWKRIGIILDKIIGQRINRFKHNLFFELMKRDETK